MYAWCMRASGWAVAEAADGLEALRLATAFEPDVIVMDLYLPVVDGFEAIRRLRMNEQTAHVPIIACTGLVLPQAETEARAAGCSAFVRKPYMPDQMCALLEGLVTRGGDGDSSPSGCRV